MHKTNKTKTIKTSEMKKVAERLTRVQLVQFEVNNAQWLVAR